MVEEADWLAVFLHCFSFLTLKTSFRSCFPPTDLGFTRSTYTLGDKDVGFWCFWKCRKAIWAQLGCSKCLFSKAASELMYRLPHSVATARTCHLASQKSVPKRQSVVRFPDFPEDGPAIFGDIPLSGFGSDHDLDGFSRFSWWHIQNSWRDLPFLLWNLQFFLCEFPSLFVHRVNTQHSTCGKKTLSSYFHFAWKTLGPNLQCVSVQVQSAAQTRLQQQRTQQGISVTVRVGFWLWVPSGKLKWLWINTC